MKRKMMYLFFAACLFMTGCVNSNNPETPPSEKEEIEEEWCVNMQDLITLKGTSLMQDEVLRSASNGFLAVVQAESGDGVFELTVNQGGVAADDGMVFAMSYPEETTNIWEGSDVSYYFYFISMSGTAYLGRTENGNWTVMSEYIIPNYNAFTNYTLKAEKREGFIVCSLDGETVFTCPDAYPLSGKYFGVRAGAVGAQFKDLVYTKLPPVVGTELKSFDVVGGSYVELDGTVMSKSFNSLAISKDDVLQTGTISVKTFIPLANGGDAGLVFGYNDSSYYYYSVTPQLSVKISKITSSGTEVLKETSLVAKHAHGTKVTLSVTFDGEKIYTYIDGVCLAIADGNGAGKWGLKSVAANSAFSDYTTSEKSTPNQADVILWGHSHMQLWDNYKTDLSGYGTVVNMGIGGSNTPYWANLVEEILSYNASTMIVMIGSNDVPVSSNDFIMDYEETIFAEIAEKNPDVHIILITEFLQPCRMQYADQTRELNQRYFAYEEKHDFITIVDAYDIPNNSDGSLNEGFFRDIYHLTTAGYDILKKRVRAAIDGTYSLDKRKNYTFVNGSFSYNNIEKTFVSSQDNSIAIRKEWFINKGEVSATLKLENNGMAGLIFNYNESGYYGAALTGNGLELYKVLAGEKKVLKTIERSYDYLSEYTLKAMFDNGEITIFVDDVELLNYSDATPLNGSKFGFVANYQSSVCKLDAIKKQGEYIYTIGDESNWLITEENGVKTYTSLKNNSLLMFPDITFTGGRIEFDMTVNAEFEEYVYLISNGVVFGASSLNVNHNYGEFYVFGRCPWETVTGFSKDNGEFLWEINARGTRLVKVGETYHYEFVWNSEKGVVEIYENGVLAAATILEQKFTGEYVGIYLETANTVITNLKFTEVN